jgi:simple sugar transport system ATP-binding protein
VLPLSEARDIVVDFGHIRALDGATLAIHRGETLALVGDNGAGKTSLVRVLGGELVPDKGELAIEGNVVRFRGVRDAHALGVHIVYQDLALAPDLTAAENMVLGHEPLVKGFAGRLGFRDRDAAARETELRLRRLQITLPNIDEKVRNLSGGQRQSLAVARGLTYGHLCMLMDEPTAALGARQTAMVYRAIAMAAESGVAVVVVSHDLTQVLEFADRVAIMRHGRVLAVEAASSLEVREIIDIMMGAVTPEFAQDSSDEDARDADRVGDVG